MRCMVVISVRVEVVGYRKIFDNKLLVMYLCYTNSDKFHSYTVISCKSDSNTDVRYVLLLNHHLSCLHIINHAALRYKFRDSYHVSTMDHSRILFTGLILSYWANNCTIVYLACCKCNTNFKLFNMFSRRK